MSNLTDFFPAPAGGGSTMTVTDPNDLPWVVTYSVASKVTVGSQYTSTNSNFWLSNTYITAEGNRTTIDDQNIYYTICDVTGSGYFYNAISNGTGGYSQTITFKFTVDDIVYEISNQTVEPNCRVFIGYYLKGWSSGNAQYPGAGYSSYSDVGGYDYYNYFSNQKALHLASGQSISLASSDIHKLYDLPKVRFENSLKVEAKITRACLGVVNGTYRNGPNTEVHNSHYYTNRAASFHYLDTPVTI